MGGDLAPARGATTFLSHATYHLSMVSVLAFISSALTRKNPFGPCESDYTIEQLAYGKAILLFGTLSEPMRNTTTSCNNFCTFQQLRQHLTTICILSRFRVLECRNSLLQLLIPCHSSTSLHLANTLRCSNSLGVQLIICSTSNT